VPTLGLIPLFVTGGSFQVGSAIPPELLGPLGLLVGTILALITNAAGWWYTKPAMDAVIRLHTQQITDLKEAHARELAAVVKASEQILAYYKPEFERVLTEKDTIINRVLAERNAEATKRDASAEKVERTIDVLNQALTAIQQAAREKEQGQRDKG
jgi:hypothetical protein